MRTSLAMAALAGISLAAPPAQAVQETAFAARTTAQLVDLQDSAQTGIAAGAGLGTAPGALLGSLSGNFGWGALIGAAAGTAGGYLYERDQRNG